MLPLIVKTSVLLKKLLVILMLGSLASVSLTACNDEKEKIEADSYLVDSEDASLYRVLDDGEEEFLVIKGNKEAENFMCWHKEDVKKWADLLTKKCKE